MINLDTLMERFEPGVDVTLDLLREHGLIHGSKRKVKILARGDLTKALTVHAHRFSGKAAEKITSGGGQAVVIESSVKTTE